MRLPAAADPFYRRLFITLALLLLITGESRSQQEAGFGGDAIRINAEDGIEWDSENRRLVALGDATARRGDTSVRADRLTALYRELPGHRNQVYRVEATGRVVIAAAEQNAGGDQATYDLDAEIIVIKGKSIFLKTGTETITARDSLEYRGKSRLAIARGAAEAVNGARSIRADTLTAQFLPVSSGQHGIAKVEAIGNVILATPQNIVRANEGVYDAQIRMATLTGNVRITRGESQLNGEFAEINLNTGVGRLTSGPGPNDRVEGLIVPEARTTSRDE